MIDRDSLVDWDMMQDCASDDNIERIVTMDCLVTYIKEDVDAGKFLYGVNIEDIDEDDSLFLRGFIYQELLRGIHMI